jgi:CHASE3 domain sensor protein
MPPEQARGEVGHLDKRSDVFGLGAMLCEILTGSPPYTGSREEVRTYAQDCFTVPALARLETCGADGELAALARSCLSAKAAARPADAGTVAAAMAAHLVAVQERLRRAEALAEERKAIAEAARKAWRGTRVLGIMFGRPLIMFLVFSLFTYRSTGRMTAAAGRVARSSFVLEQVERLMSLTTDINLAQRGYVITGDERYAELCENAVIKLDDALAQLDGTNNNDPTIQQWLKRTRPQLAQRWGEVQELIRLRRDKGFAAAQARLMADEGWGTMDDIRRATETLARNKHATLRLRKQEYEDAVQEIQAIICVGGFVLLNGFTMSCVMLYREMSLRWRGEQRYRRMIAPSSIGLEKGAGNFIR